MGIRWGHGEPNIQEHELVAINKDDILSDSGSCPEWYSELLGDDSFLKLYSEVFDMA